MIAGFDIEHNQTAADGTVYDNGYGICMIPKTYVTQGKWSQSNTISGAYMNSTIHVSTLVDVVSKLQIILGSHIVTRNVLLSSSIDSNYHSSAYTWTSSYATLMSVGQMNGTFARYMNKYDDGEANYKLPIFNFTNYTVGLDFWTRGIWGTESNSTRIWRVSDSYDISRFYATSSLGVRPMIYLR